MFAYLQRIGRALMLPIAVLPAAGILLRFGQSDLLNIPWMADAGNAVFSNLPLLFAVGVAVILGAVFYGLNSTSVHEAQTPPPAQTAQTQNNPQVAPPKANTQPGMTTGSATSQPTPPQNAPQGTEVDRSKTK